MKYKNLKFIKLFSIIFLVFIIFFTNQNQINAYVFGLKSSDNTIENIKQIESDYFIHIPIISFIFDPWGDEVELTINNLTKNFGEDRIYHITISPNNFSALQVASGFFDKEYKQFFDLVKKNNLRVIFRTMHEMNGGRYPRSSDPINFKKAWIHVWNLSREQGLKTENILFDMSVNHRDMPTNQIPSQTARLITCQLSNKIKKKCFTFEDYYPGDEYVDIMGFTFFNRGKGNSDRQRLRPEQIVNQKGRNILSRLKKIGKPIFIDEVATTSVWYEGNYSQQKTENMFGQNSDLKNHRLFLLKRLLYKNGSILGFSYFNVDYTNGLTEKIIGEADRSVIDFNSNKLYDGIFGLYQDTEKFENNAPLLSLFNISLLNLSGNKIFVRSDYVKPIKSLYNFYSGNNLSKLNQLSVENLQSKYKRFNKSDLNNIIQILKSFYNKKN